MITIRTPASISMVCLVLGLVMPLPATVTPSLTPESWGERYARALLEGSPAAMEAVIPEVFAEATLRNPGPERLLGQMTRLRDTIAPDEFHHAELVTTELTPGHSRRILHVYVRRKGNATWQDIQMILDAAPPHQIASIAFVAEVAEPVPLPNGAIEDPMTLGWLHNYVDKLVRENDLAGSALVARGENVIFERHFGFADEARTIRVDARTLFNLGSGNKMFTALAVHRLMEAGQLRSDDPLTKFFPDFPSPERARAVTVRHLLTHSSGVAEFWRPETEAEMRRAASWRDLLGIVRQVGFDFDPGTKASYSNSNFLLLGAIIEQVTGRNYFDIITEQIYRPAGMMESGSFVYDRIARPLAMPLVRSAGGTGWAEAPHMSRGSPTGGGYSTCADILRFARALQRGTLLAPARLKEMTVNANAALSDGFPYGQGFIPEKHGQVASYGHGGIARGINFEFRYFPTLDITLVLFSNQDNGAYDDLRKNLTKLITGMR